jgi:hypothetical protein
MYDQNHPSAAPSFAIPDPDTSPITYVLVRTDIPGAQQTVQAIHAAMGAAAKFGEPAHNHLALLAVPDQPSLLAWGCRLKEAGVGFHAFFEPDNEMGYSSLSTAPLTRDQGVIFRSLPLWSCPLSSGLDKEMGQEDVAAAPETGVPAARVLAYFCNINGFDVPPGQ